MAPFVLWRLRRANPPLIFLCTAFTKARQSARMKLAHVATPLQILATALIGLMAGFFFAFSVDVVPAMRNFNAHDYIATQQAINRAVRNIPFALVYFGAAIVPFLAAGATWLAG